MPVEGVYGTGLAKTVDELLDEVRAACMCCLCPSWWAHAPGRRQGGWLVPSPITAATLVLSSPFRRLHAAAPVLRHARGADGHGHGRRTHVAPSPKVRAVVACLQVQKNESVLQLDGGKALRIVNVLSVHVLNGRGQVRASGPPPPTLRCSDACDAHPHPWRG